MKKIIYLFVGMGVLGLDVLLSWEINDVIELCFVQNGQKVKTTATVTSVLEEGKKAVFEYTIPGSINPEQPYDLYGVYGGAGLDAENPSLAVLNAGTGTGRLTLDDVKTYRDVLFWFDKKGITGTTVNTANFKHIGTLISVTISNTSNTSLQFASMKYASSVGDNWVYNAGETPSKFDLTTGNLYPGTENSAAASLFKATTPTVTINPDQDFTFWQWIVPMGVQAKNQLTSLDFTHNTKLMGIHCYSNKILNNEMNSMILSMPALPGWHIGGRVLLFDSQDSNEQNSHTTEQVELLNSKRWKVYDYNNAHPIEIGSVTSPFQ